MRGEGLKRNKCNLDGLCDERGNKGCQLNKRRVLFNLTPTANKINYRSCGNMIRFHCTSSGVRV